MSGRRGYAIGHLRGVRLGPDIRRYLEEIEATMAPFGGEFLVHGTTAEVLEGPPVGDVILIGFPSVQAARDWYASPAYQAILPLRTEHAQSNVVLLEGVSEGYRAAETVAKVFGS
ncbi:DUF1330 domain-containing protein [Aeromicrobium massiliense]|uniref:DUF1330 domain-containing protein n=1 Tax=Aeromicrobium massiliense TaxID=1464554 RepID=UPI0003155497|nr:DUF1330 domain-containing protein [Aeromicrobium massiliense]